MDELTNRLIRCFAAIFPNLPADRIPEAKADNIREWDSLASVTLFALIEEEFAAQIDFRELQDLTFLAIKNYLKTHNLVS
jgi:acyl carrier protein